MSREVKRTATRWARLAVGYFRDPKILAVGPVGELAFIRLLALAREVVESVDADGAVPKVLAKRELVEALELYSQLNPGLGFDDLMQELADVGLIKIEKKHVIVRSYGSWQTTRDEIAHVRQDNRERVAAWRARKNNNGKNDHNDSLGGEDEEMGVYDTQVEAFTDLREAGAVKTGKNKVGKHGLNPKQVADAERIVEHLVAKRKEILGGNVRVSASWWSDVKKLLNGSGDTPAFTADQACDLIEFALLDKFWHAHCQTPAGLAKHGGKLFSSDEFVAWSKGQGKPAANRPRETLIRDKGAPSFKGSLAADKKVDWSQVSGEL